MSGGRTCIVCRKKADKSRFIRLAKNKSGMVSVDVLGTLEGRGAYLCPTCIEGCIKKRALNKAFKGEIEQSVYEELKSHGTKQA